MRLYTSRSREGAWIEIFIWAVKKTAKIKSLP